MTTQKVPITLIIRMEYEAPADWDAAMIKFHIEENYCIDNHIDQLVRDNITHPGVCENCVRGNAVVGHHYLKEEPGATVILQGEKQNGDG